MWDLPNVLQPPLQKGGVLRYKHYATQLKTHKTHLTIETFLFS